MVLSASGRRLVFQPTLPARGATQPAPRDLLIRLDFNPRSPRGERPDGQRIHAAFQRFQPTLPARGATDVGAREHRHNAFQPTLPARGATKALPCIDAEVVISTHAPREGSDPRGRRSPSSRRYFNPRSPRGERPYCLLFTCPTPTISTHAPREGSDRGQRLHQFKHCLISTHAPREGSDVLPVVGRGRIHAISTHAPREGSDRMALIVSRHSGHFNPRSPRGERLLSFNSSVAAAVDFNPRSPRGERPSPRRRNSGRSTFQPTLPARGATAARRPRSLRRRDFNPRSPRGERPQISPSSQKQNSAISPNFASNYNKNCFASLSKAYFPL